MLTIDIFEDSLRINEHGLALLRQYRSDGYKSHFCASIFIGYLLHPLGSDLRSFPNSKVKKF